MSFLKFETMNWLTIYLCLGLIVQQTQCERMFRYKVTAVTESRTELGEGPYWDKANRLLYYVDAFVGNIVQLNPSTGTVVKQSVGDLATMVIPYEGEPDSLLVSKRHEVRKMNWATGESTLVATVSPELGGLERFNDAKCDPRGRLFIGTVLNTAEGGLVPNGGGLYRLDGSNFIKVSDPDSGFTITNGLAWSNDVNHTKLYLNDSEGRKIYSFDYDIETGNLSNQTVMIDCDTHEDFLPGEYPDGMVIDKLGHIWVCMYAGHRIVRIDPETTRIVQDIQLETAGIPTSLAFGEYEGNFGFYVTTSFSETLPDDGKILFVTWLGAEVYNFSP